MNTRLYCWSTLRCTRTKFDMVFNTRIYTTMQGITTALDQNPQPTATEDRGFDAASVDNEMTALGADSEQPQQWPIDSDRARRESILNCTRTVYTDLWSLRKSYVILTSSCTAQATTSLRIA